MALQFWDIVLPLCRINNIGAVATCQTTLFRAHHNITTVDNLTLLKPNQAKDLVKQFSLRYLAQRLGILVQNNLTGLIWYTNPTQLAYQSTHDNGQ